MNAAVGSEAVSVIPWPLAWLGSSESPAGWPNLLVAPSHGLAPPITMSSPPRVGRDISLATPANPLPTVMWSNTWAT